MASIKRFRVSFNGGMPDMIAFGFTRAQVSRNAKKLYGPAVIAKVDPISKRGAEGLAFMPLPWNAMISVQEAGYMDPPKTDAEKKKRYPDIETDVKNKKSKDLQAVKVNEKTLTPAELKKREEIAQAIERENPSMDKSKKMAIATSQAKKVVEARETNPVVATMKETLASAFTLYLKSQNFHWNVKGPHFSEYHEFFGKYYNFVYEQVDKIAEQIRALDAAAPGSMVEFIKTTKIAEAQEIDSAEEMFSSLASDNQTMINVLTAATEVAEAAGKKGLVNYLEGAIDEFNKYGWMIRSVGRTAISEGMEIKGVKITSSSPDANGDGEVDEDDDLNGDGVVDTKDLKIAELEKDLHIKQLEQQLDDMDDQVPEEGEAAGPVMPERPRIKDRGDCFEVIDHTGKTLKKFKYDTSGEGQSSRDARHDARIYVSQWYHDQLSQAVKAGKTAEPPMPEEFDSAGAEEGKAPKEKKKFEEALTMLQKKKHHLDSTIGEENPCWDGYKKVPGKKDYEEDSCVKEEEVEEVLKPGWMLKADPELAKKVKAKQDIYKKRVASHGNKSAGKSIKEDYCPDCQEDPCVCEGNHVKEGNAFIFAAAKAKQAGKKTFEFNGKTYKVKLKSHSLSEGEELDQDELEHMVEAFDADKLTLLARSGMVSRDQLATLKMAMKSMEEDKPLRPVQRQVIIDLFGKLADLATNDSAVFQKAKKFAKEDVAEGSEYTSANFYADYIKFTKR